MNEFYNNNSKELNQNFYNKKPKKSRWWIPFVIIGIVIVFFITTILAFSSIIGSIFQKEVVEVKNNSVIHLKLGQAFDEYASESPISFLSKKNNVGFLDVLNAIRIAKTDDRIKGIYLDSKSSLMGYAKAKELIDVLEDFKKSGKFIYAYLETGSELEYYRCLPATKIFISKEGLIELNGFAASSLFLKNFLANFGIEMLVDQHEDFKSFGESYSRTKYSDSAKKQLREIINQRYNLFIKDVSYYRGIEESKIKEILNKGVYSAQDLLAYGLVDSLISENDVKDLIKKEIYGDSNDDINGKQKEKKKVNFISIANYYHSDLPEINNVAENVKIAIINGVGPIYSSKEANILDGNEKSISSKEFIKYLKEARENSSINAILIRIDSPGGSVIASDEIYEEIIKTKKVKPVYASMSDVAASGGYYIAMACDTIIAHPNTITGSIGVISVVPNISGMLKKLDITVDTIATSSSAVELSPYYPYSQEQKNKLHNLTGGMYKRFVEKVANSRKMTFDNAKSIAKGRVWTGEYAKRIGLVDTLGGIITAINVIKQRLGVDINQKVKVEIYPKPNDDFLSFLKLFDSEANSNSSISQVVAKIAKSNSEFYTVYNALPSDLKAQVDYLLNLLAISEKEKVLMALPEYFLTK